MPKATYDADQREMAKSKGLPLFMVDMDGRNCPKGSPFRSRINIAGTPLSAKYLDHAIAILTELREHYSHKKKSKPQEPDHD